MSVKISQKQKEFLDWEFGVFFHFGIRTFYEGHVDWDLKEMPVEGFNPTELDCENWIKAISEAGAKYAVLVCKHHDGFANWPSKYTDYSVANSPWKNGKGDVVDEYVKACRKYGVKVGLYYSPAQFGSVKMNAEEYDDYFINQISELLTNYGKIDYLWFDGCGSEGHQYNTKRIIAEIRSLQPEILIFNMWDPDTAWCKNERGYCEMPNYNVREFEGEMKYLPYECDCRIRQNWFYFDSDRDTLKDLDTLMGIYLYSVGRGANLLLNIGPDRRGLLLEEDIKRIKEFGDEIKRRFGTPLKRVEKPEATDGKVSIVFDDDPALHAVILKEDLEADDVIEDVDVSVSIYNNEDEIYLGRAVGVGHKLIFTFPTIIGKRITLRLKCKGEIKLNEISVY
ncbi:MAG: alpha-L-fucosidase [Clostridia bacterium]|nr:alpha-L-fucosidase [Clostridia bacterium]